MASRVQKIKFWDTFKNAKSVILHFFPVAKIGRNIHLLYFSYPQQIYSQFVEWGKKVLSPYSPQWSVYFPVLLLLITRKHPVFVHHNPSKSNIIVVAVCINNLGVEYALTSLSRTKLSYILNAEIYIKAYSLIIATKQMKYAFSFLCFLCLLC